jgi:hypothetical protein
MADLSLNDLDHAESLLEESSDENGKATDALPSNSNAKGTTRPEYIQFPFKEWEEMKKQNERILKHCQDISDRDAWLANVDSEYEGDYTKYPESGEVSEVSDETPCPKTNGKRSLKRKRSNSVSDSFDSKLSKLLSKTKQQTDKNAESAQSKVDEKGLKQILLDYSVEEETGKEIEQDLAELFETMAKGQMKDDTIEKKLAKYKRPKNCNISVPRVNSELWGILDHAAKSSDLRIQRRQKLLQSAATALTSIAQECVTSDKLDQSEILTTVSDAAGLLLKVFYDMSMDRRTKVLNAPQVNKKYRKLATADIPVTNQLFGDDLKAATASIDSTSKLGASFTQSSRGRKFFPKRGAKNLDPRNQWQWDPQRAKHNSWSRGRPRGRFPRYRGRFPRYGNVESQI